MVRLIHILQWTYKNAENINGNKKQIVVVGDSAGGNLSAAVSLMARNKSGPQITCQVLIYPSTNIYELNTQSWSYFANDFNISMEDMEKYISLYQIYKKYDNPISEWAQWKIDYINYTCDSLDERDIMDQRLNDSE